MKVKSDEPAINTTVRLKLSWVSERTGDEDSGRRERRCPDSGTGLDDFDSFIYDYTCTPPFPSTYLSLFAGFCLSNLQLRITRATNASRTRIPAINDLILSNTLNSYDVAMNG